MPFLLAAVFCFVATFFPKIAVAFEIDTPAGLETEVQFWEDVFSKYTPDHCVFHDKDNLTKVYAVVKLPENKQTAKKLSKKYADAIQNGLLHLSGGGRPRTKLERNIVSVTEIEQRFPAYYRYAMNNFRCQRGVDLNPSILRSRKLVNYIRKTLEKNGLPEDLAYLPHLESGFIANARSHAGARGLWQFMPATARIWGLRVNRKVDDRVNVWKATDAASKHFLELYRKAGSWPLAVTAYNYGINGTMRAINLHGSDYLAIRQRHETSIFGFAAKNYFPSFIAARNIASQRDGSERSIPKASIASGDDIKASSMEKL
jgi:membrane-bound lytic murein transglycosylase D